MLIEQPAGMADNESRFSQRNRPTCTWLRPARRRTGSRCRSSLPCRAFSRLRFNFDVNQDVCFYQHIVFDPHIQHCFNKHADSNSDSNSNDDPDANSNDDPNSGFICHEHSILNAVSYRYEHFDRCPSRCRFLLQFGSADNPKWFLEPSVGNQFPSL